MEIQQESLTVRISSITVTIDSDYISRYGETKDEQVELEVERLTSTTLHALSKLEWEGQDDRAGGEYREYTFTASSDLDFMSFELVMYLHDPSAESRWPASLDEPEETLKELFQEAIKEAEKFEAEEVERQEIETARREAEIAKTNAIMKRLETDYLQSWETRAQEMLAGGKTLEDVRQAVPLQPQWVVLEDPENKVRATVDRGALIHHLRLKGLVPPKGPRPENRSGGQG